MKLTWHGLGFSGGLPLLVVAVATGCSGTIADSGEASASAGAAGASMAVGSGGAAPEAAAMGGAAALPVASGGGAMAPAPPVDEIPEAEAGEGSMVPMDLEGDSPEAVPGVCDAMRTVLQPKCGGGDCHVGVGIGNFAIGEKEAATYVDQPPVFNAAVCGLMIDSSDPERSFILTKVTGRPPYYSDDCKTRMPIGGGAEISTEEVDCLRSWLGQFRR